MYCPHCGTQLPDASRRCTACSRDIPPLRTAAATSSIGDDPAMRMILPVGRSFLAIAAGYAGLFAILVVPAPIALVLGILAIRDLRRHPDKHGMGRAVFGLVMGGLGTALLLLVLVLAMLGS